MEKQINVYVKKSNIAVIGNGLFAKTSIKKDDIIAEFKGQLRKPGEICQNQRSNIYFNDGHILECADDDLASYANDAINFTRERRQLMKSLRSKDPFYVKHENAKINAEIELDEENYRAFLIATCDIITDDEIFCHYGFMYWFRIEAAHIGFIPEAEIELKGFPDIICIYPGFISYIKHFYPNSIKCETKQYEDDYVVTIHLDSGRYIHVVMNYLSRVFSKVTLDKFDQLRTAINLLN